MSFLSSQLKLLHVKKSLSELNYMTACTLLFLLHSSRKKGGRARCTLTVIDRDIQVSAEASSHKAAKSAAARAALRKIKAQL